MNLNQRHKAIALCETFIPLKNSIDFLLSVEEELPSLAGSIAFDAEKSQRIKTLRNLEAKGKATSYQEEQASFLASKAYYDARAARAKADTLRYVAENIAVISKLVDIRDALAKSSEEEWQALEDIKKSLTAKVAQEQEEAAKNTPKALQERIAALEAALAKKGK